MTNTVNPDYYNKHSVTVGNVTVYPIDLIGSADFDLGNVFKYLLRWKDKGQTEDLKKALTYLEHYKNKQLLSKEDEILRLAAKEVLFNDLKDNNPLLKKFIDNLPKVKGCTYLGEFRNLQGFKADLEQIVSNLEKGLQPITREDINDFAYAMQDFSSFVLKIYNDSYEGKDIVLKQIKDFLCKPGCTPVLKVEDLSQFKERLEHIQLCLDAPVAFPVGEFVSNCHLVLEYVRDIWLACFFSAVSVWPNKSILDITGVIAEARNDTSDMLNGKLLLDTEAIKKDTTILSEIYKDYKEFRRKKGKSIPILDLIYQMGNPYDYSFKYALFGTAFFPTILKVLYQGKDAPTMN